MQQVAATPQPAVEQRPFVATEPEAVERETAQPFNPQQSELQRLLNQATPPAAPVAGALTRRQLRELTSGGGVAEPTPVVPTAQIPAPSAAPGTPFGDVAVMPATNTYTAPATSFDDLLAGTETPAPDATAPAPASAPVPAPAPLPPVAQVAAVAEPVAVAPVVAAPVVAAVVAAPVVAAPVVAAAVAPQAAPVAPYVEPAMPNVNPYSQPVATAAPIAPAVAPAAPVHVAKPIVTSFASHNTHSNPTPSAPVMQHAGTISADALFAPAPTGPVAFGAAQAVPTATAATDFGAFAAAKPTSGYAPFSAEMSQPNRVDASLLATNTLPIWLFALWPALLSVGVVAALMSFDLLLDIPTAAFGGLYIVLNLLFASADRKKLESIGHDRGVNPWWSLLPLVFLIIRTARLGARSVAPLIVWLLANVASAAVGLYGFQLIAAQAGITLPFTF